MTERRKRGEEKKIHFLLRRHCRSRTGIRSGQLGHIKAHWKQIIWTRWDTNRTRGDSDDVNVWRKSREACNPTNTFSLSLSGGNTEYNAVKIVQWMWNLESGDGDRKKKRKQREFFFISTSSTWQNWHLVKGLSCVNVTTMWHWLKEMKVVNHPCRKVVTEY